MIPFVIGAIVGAAAVVAVNNNEKIKKQVTDGAKKIKDAALDGASKIKEKIDSKKPDEETLEVKKDD
ncbi:MAG: hypothetical protein WC982_11750 [Advenella sp.]